MGMKKKISIIIPCYNVEKYIDRCIQSLVNQTIGIDNLECIFVDDASTDKTMDKLAQWEEKYPESIMIIHCEENKKQGAARNIGLGYAGAPYIGFVDSDDYVSLDMYEKLYEKAADYDCDVVAGLFVREENDGTIAMAAEPQENGDKLVKIQDVQDRKRFLQEGLTGGVWSKIYKRELILENELYFPEDILYEDNYWSAFLMHAISSYYVINEPYYHYMVNEESTIMKKDATHHLDRLIIELMKVEEYKRRGLFDAYHDEIEFAFLRMYFINTIRILFVRFRQIPYEIIYTMQDNVKTLFPDYDKNPYLGKLPQLQAELLKIVSVPLDKEKIDVLAEAYKKVLLDNC